MIYNSVYIIIYFYIEENSFFNYKISWKSIIIYQTTVFQNVKNRKDWFLNKKIKKPLIFLINIYIKMKIIFLVF